MIAHAKMMNPDSFRRWVLREYNRLEEDYRRPGRIAQAVIRDWRNLDPELVDGLEKQNLLLPLAVVTADQVFERATDLQDALPDNRTMDLLMAAESQAYQEIVLAPYMPPESPDPEEATGESETLLT